METKSIIFDCNHLDEKVPDGFNAVKVRIDGGLKSDLLWKGQKDLAEKFIEQGLKIFWDLDLGIFSGLSHPLSHNSQFLSLKLSVEHFRDFLGKEFKEHTVGVSLYRGSLDFYKGFVWNEEEEANLCGWLEDHFKEISCLKKEIGTDCSLFSKLKRSELESTKEGMKILQLYSRDALSEYLELLSNQLPFETQAFLVCDAEGVQDPVHIANMLSKDRFLHFNLAVKNGESVFREFGWENEVGFQGFLGRSLPQEREKPAPNIAVCLPSYAFFKPSDYPLLASVFKKLCKKGWDFRQVSESLLTSEWDGLDYLIVPSPYLTSQSKRMLRGFCAAGGVVVSLAGAMGLASEIDEKEFFRLG